MSKKVVYIEGKLESTIIPIGEMYLSVGNLQIAEVDFKTRLISFCNGKHTYIFQSDASRDLGIKILELISNHLNSLYPPRPVAKPEE